jgi:ATP-dependent RNA helicase HelY
MLLNLLEHRNITATKLLLNKSFAQFSQEKSNLKIKQRIIEERKALEGYSSNLACEKGDFKSYYALVQKINKAEKSQKISKREKSRKSRFTLGEELNAGSVVRVKTSGKYQTGLVTRIVRERKGKDSYWIVLENGDGKKFHLNEIDPVQGIISEIAINRGLDFSKREARKQVSKILASFDIKRSNKNDKSEELFDVEELRSQIRQHQCHSCKDLYEHLRWAERKEKLEKSINTLEFNFNISMMSLSKKCDEVLKLLVELGYIDISSDNVALKSQALILKEIHSDQDLLTAESIVKGLLEDLSVEEMPAVLSGFVYQPRRDEYEIPGNLTSKIRERAKDLSTLANELINLEMKYKLEYVRLPHFGISEQMRKWAQGESLQKVLRNTDLAPGDFVRVAKQVTDLLRQIAKLNIGIVSDTAREAVHKINRGVVAYEPMVFDDVDEPIISA